MATNQYHDFYKYQGYLQHFHPQDHLLQQVEVPSDHPQLQKLYVQHQKGYF